MFENGHSNGNGDSKPMNGNTNGQPAVEKDVEKGDVKAVKELKSASLGTTVHPVTIHCSGLTVKAGKTTILHGIDTNFAPGTITALMGPSGAGKTTLLNVLSGRQTEYSVKCDLLSVNGEKLSAKTMKELSSLVPQHDILISVLTPRESLMYTSKLCMKGNSGEHLERVDRILKKLSLESCADVINGDQDLKGLSGGERKRVSIGVELITNPSCLFLDEPTSGLDAKIAMDVITVLHTLAGEGRTIVCTIHQPNYEMFVKFEKLILLSKGSVVFMGDVAKVPSYFESIGFPVPTYSNPADHMLNVVSEKTPTNYESFNAAYRDSELGKEFYRTKKQFEEGALIASNAKSGTKIIKSRNKKKGTSFFNQWLVLAQRSTYATLRDKKQFIVRSMQMVIMGLIIGLTYLQLDRIQTAIFDRQAAMLLMTTFYTMSSILGTIIAIPLEKAVLLRETANGFYGGAVFALSRLTVFYVFQAWYCALIACIAYPMIGLHTGGGHMAIFYCVLLLLGWLAVSLGFVFGTVFSSVQQAIAVVPTIVIPFLLFSGLFVAKDNIPVYFIWMYYISFLQYAFQLFMVNEFKSLEFEPCSYKMRTHPGQCPLGPCNGDGSDLSIPAESCSGRIVLDNAGYDLDKQWINVVVLFALWIAFALLSIYRTVKFVKK